MLDLDELILRVLRAYQTFDFAKILFLATTALIGVVLAVFIRGQIKKLRSLIAEVKAVAEKVGVSATAAEQSAKAAGESSLKVEQSTKELSETVLSLDQATNLLQAARGGLENSVRQLDQHTSVQALAGMRSQMSATATGYEDYKFEVRDLWARAKDLLEAQIQNITDGRRLKKYGRINRGTYQEVIDNLRRDGEQNGGLSEDRAEAARIMASQIIVFEGRHSAPVTRSERDEFARLAKLLRVDTATLPTGPSATIYQLEQSRAQ
jgi:hypothetical protein